MLLCVGILRAFGAAMFMLCASWLVVGVCVFPFEFSNQGVVFGRGLSECWLACVFVFVCVVARFVLVSVWTRMCLCVLSPCLFFRLLVALVLCRVGLLVMFPVQVGVVWPLLRLLHTLPPLAVSTP